MSKERPTLEERLQSLQQGFFGRNREIKEADPLEPTPMRVTIDRVKEYDRNPRREPNQAYELIKHSIRQRGFRGTLPITRRPGDEMVMVAEGGNTVFHILKELHQETGEPRFYTICCLFEPWVSESETLIAHLIENDNRGQLIFIDRARAVRELRELLAHERGEPIGTRALAARLRERGYTLDHPVIARMDYAIDTLFPVIPLALRGGLGIVQVERIRRIESILVAFLESRSRQAAVIENARQWFLDCLARHDSEHLSLALDAIQRELEAYAAELCGESSAKARADFALIEQTGKPGEDAGPPVPFKLPDRPASGRSGAETAARAQPTNAAATTERSAVDTVDTSAPDNVDEAFDVEQPPPGDEVQVLFPARRDPARLWI
ncbi:MAG: ParB family protein, partial [Gammaproteobacteria bacterium]